MAAYDNKTTKVQEWNLEEPHVMPVKTTEVVVFQYNKRPLAFCQQVGFKLKANVEKKACQNVV